MLRIRQATFSDLELILRFIDEASRWLHDKGTDQWAQPWPNRAERDERVRSGLVDGRTWMVDDEQGEAIATVTGRPDGNPLLWTLPEQVEPAVYVSRLIVGRAYSGRAIGDELLNWAGNRARQHYGARWIRIDVWTTNDALHDYYRKRGFEFVRQRQDVDYPSAMLFQRPTAPLRSESWLQELPARQARSRMPAPAGITGAVAASP
ncbi:MAG TPA: GNAT family N-acetyltransferase [Streptosporangiaceae bacterium]|jgi:ribosomal protein S18 acetylase RimI-like enzyme